MQYISQLSSSTFLWNCALCLPSQQLNWCQKSCRRQRIFQLVKADASTTWQALAGRQLFKRQTARVSITYLLASTKHCNVFTKTWDLNFLEMLAQWKTVLSERIKLQIQTWILNPIAANGNRKPRVWSWVLPDHELPTVTELLRILGKYRRLKITQWQSPSRCASAGTHSGEMEFCSRHWSSPGQYPADLTGQNTVKIIKLRFCKLLHQ